ncbi:MAG: class I SAM-dependent methyltransferase [Chloroflexi bacterium]|nr:class I SAM-dependent methyltransferase [Chloroflexota bacterium]MCI0580042.1 class I SAM-dependent methyltransferase [Chloroflexota bacterium]MCI0646763.1 class I SAM-dependent methyltransferase [Chloroflexota bacterium]MCI0730209.1 class I SAM-dependent methyltransferase [Chloroflexota bacterium]
MEKTTATLQLKKERDKPIVNRHPWIFSGAIAGMAGRPEPGDLVDVTASDGRWLARGYYNPHSQIRVRLLTWNPDEVIDENFWGSKIARAVTGREALQLEPETNAYRLIYGESDGLPGLVVDRYGSYLVIQCLTLGIDRRKEMLIDTLADMLKPAGIVERSDVGVREKEGLTEIAGVRTGRKPPDELLVREQGHQFSVNLLEGHKTGLYLDQRENRAIVCQPRFVAGREVLNVFAYTGGFALYAAAAGAKCIINVDDSADLLVQAERNTQRNGHARPQDEYIAGDAFQVLRHYRDRQRQFDVVILDPPKFAYSQHDVEAACRGYKDLNWLGMRLLRAGGLLATFSCSGLVGADLFQKVLFAATIDAGRDAQIIQQLSQAADHPVSLTFPESAYLKGFLCRVW